MCIAVPAEIKKIYGDRALVSYGGVDLAVNVALIEEPQIGEYVLIHAGCAIEKIDNDEASKTLEIFKELADAMNEGGKHEGINII